MQNMSTVRDDFHKERRVGLFKQFIETQQVCYSYVLRVLAVLGLMPR